MNYIDSNDAFQAPEFYNQLKEALYACEWQVKSLEVGDIEIAGLGRIERKEILDFQASIADRRLFIQALAAARAGVHMIYVIYPENFNALLKAFKQHWATSEALAYLHKLGHITAFLYSRKSAISYLAAMFKVGLPPLKPVNDLPPDLTPAQQVLALIPLLKMENIRRLPASITIDHISALAFYCNREEDYADFHALMDLMGLSPKSVFREKIRAFLTEGGQ